MIAIPQCTRIEKVESHYLEISQTEKGRDSATSSSDVITTDKHYYYDSSDQQLLLPAFCYGIKWTKDKSSAHPHASVEVGVVVEGMGGQQILAYGRTNYLYFMNTDI